MIPTYVTMTVTVARDPATSEDDAATALIERVRALDGVTGVLGVNVSSEDAS